MCLVTPNEDDTFLRKLKTKFEKCDTLKTCPKALTLLKLNKMAPQGQLNLDNSELNFVQVKITCCITQNTSLFYKSMPLAFQHTKH